MTNNKKVLEFVAKIQELVNPDSVMWIDGSEAQLDELRATAVKTGEMIKLNEEKLQIHRST